MNPLCMQDEPDSHSDWDPDAAEAAVVAENGGGPAAEARPPPWAKKLIVNMTQFAGHLVPLFLCSRS